MKTSRDIMIEGLFGSREAPNEKARLPKSFGHWCRINGLKFNKSSAHSYSQDAKYTEGCASDTRCFRALPHLGIFQICDGDMDRWANSVGAEISMPQTKAEFESAIRELIDNAEKSTVSSEEMVERAEKDLGYVDRQIEDLHERYGWIAEVVNRYGHDGKWSRRKIHLYKRNLKAEFAKRRYLIKRLGLLKATSEVLQAQ